MRSFDATPEPAGAAPKPSSGPGGRFVVQRHRATRLHYDFRLEINGVLASWAVPKGPSLDPKVRRQAIHVEDHPIEYFEFEGVIPKGQYGGGDVIVWDWGHWIPAKGVDPGRAIKKGELHFDIEGKKLRGRFALVRTERAANRANKEQWLLIHKNDDFAIEGWDAENFPQSVKTGRTNDEVAGAPDARWRSDLPVDEAEEKLRVEVPTWDSPTEDEIDALEELKAEGRWELQGQELRVTNLTKVLFPARPGEQEVTKRDLIRYVARIGPWILPYLWDRPVNLHRYPNGADKPGFWHKEVPALEHLRVLGQPKVTGKRGIQIWVPIASGCSFDQTRAWVESISRAIGATVPDLVSWKWTKADRSGLARLDYTQNAINKTLVAPFSTRPAAGAPVSVPIDWDELDDESIRPDRWTINDVFDRLAEHGDPLRPLIGLQQPLPAV